VFIPIESSILVVTHRFPIEFTLFVIPSALHAAAFVVDVELIESFSSVHATKAQTTEQRFVDVPHAVDSGQTIDAIDDVLSKSDAVTRRCTCDVAP
jgi:hypothetical protein